jgi:DNA (cytosine-5)-methyltransferase 1
MADARRAERPRIRSGREPLRVAGLFAGIGGIELGLKHAGHDTVYLCENDPAACAVLRARFPDTILFGDVRELHHIGGGVGLLTAGFPCQDLSQAGATAGIDGERSGLVGEVFRLLQQEPGPEWVLLENVPFMLHLAKGRAMTRLTGGLTSLGYHWAYRVVDARAFGLPQRRQRVLMLASRVRDPRPVLFEQDALEAVGHERPQAACGFYWTEGLRGLGWGVDAVPTLKGGSGLGIPSPPAIWMPDGCIVTPHICDAERLQGFPAEWTSPAETLPRGHGTRWRLIGNAVNVRVAEWLGERLLSKPVWSGRVRGQEVRSGASWPLAAWGGPFQGVVSAAVSTWPVSRPYEHLLEFLSYPLTPLSARATAGFLARADKKRLRFNEDFLADVRRHLARMLGHPAAA